MAMSIVMLGPPGAGKGTQAVSVAQRLDAPHVSTGEMFREAVRKGTPLGTKAKAYMDRGDLVPDEVVIGIVEDRLREPDTANGFVLDGFPRTVPQAEALGASLQGDGRSLACVINLSVPRDEVVRRLSGRRVCRQCGAMYHVTFDPPARADTCNRCSGELYQRDDDRKETILARLDVYARETDPLVQYYRERGLLADVDGTGSQDDVARRIAMALDGCRR
jgi:adenylate kinase